MGIAQHIIELAKMSPEEVRRSNRAMRPRWDRVGTAWPLLGLYLLNADTPQQPQQGEWLRVCDSRPVTDQQVAEALGVTEKQATRWRGKLVAAKVAYALDAGAGWVIGVRAHAATRVLLDRAVNAGIGVGRVVQSEQTQKEVNTAEAQNRRLFALLPANGHLH